MEHLSSNQRPRRLGPKLPTRMLIAWIAISGGLIIILGTWLSWFSLFAGLQPYRGVDVLNGRLLTGGGGLSILAGVWYLRRDSLRLRWVIGLLGFTLLAFASWSLFQLLIIYRQLSADPMMVAKLGPGLIVVVVGSLLIFATLFLNHSQ
ncbi:MAG TPA: hypothetical protein VIG25_12270 [Pyrinomonadaceae bacterium]